MDAHPKPVRMKPSEVFKRAALIGADLDLERDPSPPRDIDYLFPHVESVDYLGDYRLRITFQSGTIKDVDLAGELHGEVFEPLRDLVFFRQVYVNSETGTIEWPNGADFVPEFLHEIWYWQNISTY